MAVSKAEARASAQANVAAALAAELLAVIMQPQYKSIRPKTTARTKRIINAILIALTVAGADA